MADLMLEGLHVIGERGVRAAQALVKVRSFSSHWREPYGAQPSRCGLRKQTGFGLDGETCLLAVTLGRFLALFAVGLIAAAWLQVSWLYWLLGAAALWAVFKLLSS